MRKDLLLPSAFCIIKDTDTLVARLNGGLFATMTGQGSGNGKSFIWKRKACEFSFELGVYPRRSLILTSHFSSKDLKATGKLRQDITHLTCKSLLLYTAHNCPLHTSRGITFLWSNLPFPPFFTFSFDISKRRLT